MLVGLFIVVPSLTLLSLCLYLSSSFSVFLLLLTLTLSLLFFAYRLPSSPSMLHWSGTVMGHRGCRTNLNIPENSLLSFQYAMEHGAHAIELDCSLSSDGTAICMHDGTVDRTCLGTGEVGDLTFKAINTLTFRPAGKPAPDHEPVEADSEKRKRWNAPTVRNASPTPTPLPAADEPCGAEWLPSIPFPSTLLPENLSGPPSLEQVVRFAEAHGLRVMIEVKEYRRPRLMWRRLVELYARYPYLRTHSFVATFNPYHIFQLRSLAPTLPTCLLYCRDCLAWYHTDGSREMQLPALLNVQPMRWALDQLLLHSIPLVTAFLRPACLGPQNTLMAIETCEWFRQAGVMMYVWVVNRRHELQLWSEEGAVVGTDFCFPLRDKRGEGKEVREGRVEWTMRDERRYLEEKKELEERHRKAQQEAAVSADGHARPLLTVDE